MSVTIGIGAAGPVFDGSDDSQHTLPAVAAINTETVGTIEARQRLGLIVAAITGFSLLVDDVADFREIGGVADPALLVEDAYLDHAGFIGHGLYRVVESLAIVAQHVIRGAVIDDIADPLGAGQSGRFKVLAMQLDIQISQQAEDGDHERQ